MKRNKEKNTYIKWYLQKDIFGRKDKKRQTRKYIYKKIYQEEKIKRDR